MTVSVGGVQKLALNRKPRCVYKAYLRRQKQTCAFRGTENVPSKSLTASRLCRFVSCKASSYRENDPDPQGWGGELWGSTVGVLCPSVEAGVRRDGCLSGQCPHSARGHGARPCRVSLNLSHSDVVSSLCLAHMRQVWNLGGAQARNQTHPVTSSREDKRDQVPCSIREKKHGLLGTSGNSKVPAWSFTFVLVCFCQASGCVVGVWHPPWVLRPPKC